MDFVNGVGMTSLIYKMENKFHVSNHQPIAIAKQEKIAWLRKHKQKSWIHPKKQLFAKMQKKREEILQISIQRGGFLSTVPYEHHRSVVCER